MSRLDSYVHPAVAETALPKRGSIRIECTGPDEVTITTTYPFNTPPVNVVRLWVGDALVIEFDAYQGRGAYSKAPE